MVDDRSPEGRRPTLPTVLVSGEARELRRRVPLLLFEEQCDPGDAAIVVTAREDPAVVARRLSGAVAAFDHGTVAQVDATPNAGTSLTRASDLRWRAPSPVAFEDVAAAVDAARDELLDRDADRIHVLLDALTVQFRLADAAAVHKHAHDVVMAVGGERGLGVVTLAPSVTTDESFEQVRHLVDVHVAVRRTGDGPQVRWTGLVGRTDGWVPLADAGFRFDALGKSLR